MKKNKNSAGFIFENYFVNERTKDGNNSWAIVGVFLALGLLIVFRHDISCSFQGGEIIDHRPTYQVVGTGETFRGDSPESACVKKTATGNRVLFNIR